MVGKGINRNNYNLSGHELYIFSIYDIDKSTYFEYEDLVSLIQKLELKGVPIIEKDLILDHSISEIENLAEGKSLINPNIPREGIVIRSMTEISDSEIGRLSFKVINPEYELKYAD